MDVRNFPKESVTVDTGPTQPPVCGDNVWNISEEECDGVNLQSRTCETFHYSGGELRCTDDCLLDVSQCVGSVCGNGFIDSGETCDIALAPQQSRLFCGQESCNTSQCDDCGTQLCDGSCNTVPPGECGDGVLQSPTEQCDGDAFHPAFLLRIRIAPFDLATLRCVDCRIDFSNAGPAICGNQLLEGGEECEPGGGTTRPEGTTGRGECVNCRWEEDPTFCGDGIIQSEWNERCEGDLSDYPCSSSLTPENSAFAPCRSCVARLDLCPESPDSTDSVGGDEGGAGCSAAGAPTSPHWLVALLLFLSLRGRGSQRTAQRSREVRHSAA
jgi:hypothetical protein